MLFTPNQIQELIRIISFQHVLFGVSVSGSDIISDDDLELLRSFGINPEMLDVGEMSTVEQAFQFGRLASALGNYQTKKIKYDDFKKFVHGGGHRELNAKELNTLKALKTQSFQAVKGLGNRMIGSMNNVINGEDAKIRSKYEEILRKELSEGVVYRKSVAEIARELGKKTGDWTRDLGRLVETESHNAYEEGRALELEESHGKDVLVYKDVYAGACQHCIKAYLTAGINSKPRIFKLSELRANGTNVGRKATEYLPVIGGMHPHCRCTLNYYNDNYEWDTKTRSFTKPKEYKQRYEYNITIKIGGNDYKI